MDGTCDWGAPAHARNHILTTLAPPSTIELCDEHYAAGLIPLLAANLGVDPQALYTVIERFQARENRKAEKELADVQAAAAAEDSELNDMQEGDGPLPVPEPGMKYTNDGVLVPDEEYDNP